MVPDPNCAVSPNPINRTQYRVYPEPISAQQRVEGTHMTTLFQDDPYLSAIFAELELLANPFQENLEKIEEVIDRSERDGICSGEVAQAVREEIEERVLELGILFSKTVSLHQGLSNAGSVAALLTREEMLFKLNELGYPLTESYLDMISWGSEGYVGPPTVRLSRKTTLYKLDDAVAWAKSHFSSARTLVVA
jgi:hypothetical protein